MSNSQQCQTFGSCYVVLAVSLKAAVQKPNIFEMNPCWSLFLYSWNIRLEISEISCLEKYPWLSLLSEVESLGLKLISILTPVHIFSWKYTKIHRVTISQENLTDEKLHRFFNPSVPQQVPARSCCFRISKCIAQNCLATILGRIVNSCFYFWKPEK